MRARLLLVLTAAGLPMACFNFGDDLQYCEAEGWCADGGEAPDAGGDGDAGADASFAADGGEDGGVEQQDAGGIDGPLLGAENGGAGLLLVGDVVRVLDRGPWDHDPVSFEYRWQRCLGDGGSCADVPGMGDDTLVLAPLDLDAYILARVTALNDAGVTMEASTNLVGPVRRATPATPFQVNGFETTVLAASDISGENMWTAAEGRSGAWGVRTTDAGSMIKFKLPSSAPVRNIRVALRVEALNGMNYQPVMSLVGSDFERVLYAYPMTKELVFGQTTKVPATVPLVLNAWHVVDLRIENGAPIRWRVDGILQPDYLVDAGTLTHLRLGTTSTSGIEITTTFDDLYISVTPADWPVGDGRVFALKPEDAGTAASGDFTQCSGAPGLPAELINDWPPISDPSHCLQQMSPASGATFPLSDPPADGGRLFNGGNLRAQLRAAGDAGSTLGIQIDFGRALDTYSLTPAPEVFRGAAFIHPDGGTQPLSMQELQNARLFWATGMGVFPISVDSALLEVDLAP